MYLFTAAERGARDTNFEMPFCRGVLDPAWMCRDSASAAKCHFQCHKKNLTETKSMSATRTQL